MKEQTWRERKMWLKVWYPADGADPAFLSCPPAPYLILKGEGASAALRYSLHGVPGVIAHGGGTEILGKNRMVENLFDANPFGKLLGEVSWIKNHILHYTKWYDRYSPALSMLGINET